MMPQRGLGPTLHSAHPLPWPQTSRPALGSEVVFSSTMGVLSALIILFFSDLRRHSYYMSCAQIQDSHSVPFHHVPVKSTVCFLE